MQNNSRKCLSEVTGDIDRYMKILFPITRSITGEGNRQTLQVLQEIVPLSILEYPTGQRVYDWTIPKEWNISDAWIKNSEGKKVVDFKRNNLHVVSYSRPVNDTLSFDQLLPRLHYRKDLPAAIPYRTSYYADDWGFCLSYEDFTRHFEKGETYEVRIDADLKDGSLSIGELLIPGRHSQEFLISTYICHPAMANDNVSGMVMTAFLGKALLQEDLNFTYRILFVPETIGAIAYCANHETKMKAIDCGVVVSCIGGAGKFGYKQSWDPSHFINRMVEETFREHGLDPIIYPFDIHGSDERQYSSQAFRINTVSITKDKYYEYLFYHTSLDDLEFVQAENITQSLYLHLDLIEKTDKSIRYINRNPHCEPMLGRHALYPEGGGAFLPRETVSDEHNVLLWLLFYCDGNRNLWDISKKMQVEFQTVYRAARKLEAKGLLEPVPWNPIEEPGPDS